MALTKSNWKICETPYHMINMWHIFFPSIADFIAHSQDVLCAALSPSNGRTLATGGEDKRVNLWLVGQPRNITVSYIIISIFHTILFK